VGANATQPPERQVQAAARRIGLKLIRLKAIVDRYHADETGRKRYYLRPIWDARHVVRVLPSGGYELATSTRGRRDVATGMPLIRSHCPTSLT
jgi:hypothetical protein